MSYRLGNYKEGRLIVLHKIRQTSKFFTTFIRNPGEIGSVSPSSQQLASAMISSKVADEKREQIIVEFGPGTGAVTQAIVHSATNTDHLVAFEINPTFQKLISSNYPEIDLRPVSASDINNELKKENQVDHIISSIPFTFLPESVALEILKQSHIALRPGGSFTTFLYAHSMLLPKNKRFVEMAQSTFSTFESKLVVRNLPPAVVLRFRKD